MLSSVGLLTTVTTFDDVEGQWVLEGGRVNHQVGAGASGLIKGHLLGQGVFTGRYRVGLP
jgi:hypothetical protein